MSAAAFDQRSGLLLQDRCDRLRRRYRVCVPMCDPPTVVFQAKDRGNTQRTGTVAAVKRCSEPLDLNDVPELSGREGGDRLELAYPIGIVRSRSFSRFRYLAWAACERVERITEDYTFASRKHLERWPSISFEEFA